MTEENQKWDDQRLYREGCRAVVHFALAIADMHNQRGIIAEPESDPEVATRLLRSVNQYMQTLANLLDGHGAIDDDDKFTIRCFEQMRDRLSETTSSPKSPSGSAGVSLQQKNY